MRPSKWTRTKENFSQLFCIWVLDGDADEMLSSKAYRIQHWLMRWLDWLLGASHCKESFEWEKEHYKVDRFK